MSQGNEPITEKIRLIRWRMTQEKVSLADELWLIPRWVCFTVMILFALAQVAGQIMNHIHRTRMVHPRVGPVAAIFATAGIITLGGAAVACLIFLWAYVNRDAKRRGMNYVLWTFVAIVIPYFIGIIIYFLVREPLPFTCPQCKSQVSARYNFCPKCKFNLRPACPECKREVRPEDRYCPHCAHELAADAPASQAAVTP